MSPSSRDLNAVRPTPLKIHKDSHLIQKTTSSSSTTTTSSSSSTATNNNNNNSNNYHHQPPRHQPVIIYTHSPKIIHTHARDFMALIQKLTGLDSSSAAPSTSTSTSTSTSSSAPPPQPPPPPSSCSFKENCNNSSHPGPAPTQDDSESSSENCMVNNAEATYVGCTSLPSPIMPLPLGFDHQMPPLPPPFMSDVPIFTPGHGDLFCSPTSFFRYPDSVMFSSQIPNMGGPFSPSVMEVMRALQDY